MRRRRRFLAFGAALSLVLAAACRSAEPPRSAFFPIESLRGVLSTPPQVLAEPREPPAAKDEPNAVVLAIGEDNSWRAVANAVAKLRERGTAVGYWIDCAGFAGDVEARAARVRDLLRRHVHADAIFLAGLAGPPAACGCGSFECCAASAEAASGRRETAREPRESVRLVASARAYSSGALVVPVWQGGCAPAAGDCASRGCADEGCASRAKSAWDALNADSAHVALALRFEPAAAESLEARVAAQLRARPRPPGNSAIAVLPASELDSAAVARASAAVQAVGRTGLLLSRVPLRRPAGP